MKTILIAITLTLGLISCQVDKVKTIKSKKVEVVEVKSDTEMLMDSLDIIIAFLDEIEFDYSNVLRYVYSDEYRVEFDYGGLMLKIPHNELNDFRDTLNFAHNKWAEWDSIVSLSKNKGVSKYIPLADFMCGRNDIPCGLSMHYMYGQMRLYIGDVDGGYGHEVAFYEPDDLLEFIELFSGDTIVKAIHAEYDTKKLEESLK